MALDVHAVHFVEAETNRRFRRLYAVVIALGVAVALIGIALIVIATTQP